MGGQGIDQNFAGTTLQNDWDIKKVASETFKSTSGLMDSIGRVYEPGPYLPQSCQKSKTIWTLPTLMSTQQTLTDLHQMMLLAGTSCFKHPTNKKKSTTHYKLKITKNNTVHDIFLSNLCICLCFNPFQQQQQ